MTMCFYCQKMTSISEVHLMPDTLGLASEKDEAWVSALRSLSFWVVWCFLKRFLHVFIWPPLTVQVGGRCRFSVPTSGPQGRGPEIIFCVHFVILNKQPARSRFQKCLICYNWLDRHGSDEPFFLYLAYQFSMHSG